MSVSALPHATRAGLLAVLVTLGVAACGKPEAPAATAPSPAAVEDSAAAPPAAVVATAPDTTVTAPAAPETTSGEPPASDLGKEIVLADATTPAPGNWKFQQGKHFNLLPAAQGTSSSPGKIEVAEVFWYGCNHCFDLEPQINAWAARQGADVSFVKIPVMWNEVNEIHARVFYTAEALGKLDKVGPEAFRAIHLKGQQLTDENEIRIFFGQFGVSAMEFDGAWKSFGVDKAVKRAKELTARYKVRSVPLLVVNGKYTSDGPEIRSHKEQLELVDELVQRERSGS